MDSITFVQNVKKTIEYYNGCYTKTTPKKGEGFTAYNCFDVKWAQVDVTNTRIRIVLDLKLNKYDTEELKNQIGLIPKTKRKRQTGFYLKTAEHQDPKIHDAVEISLYPDFFSNSDQKKQSHILDFVSCIAKESSFKTEYPKN